jgi:hypothetical protein
VNEQVLQTILINIGKSERDGHFVSAAIFGSNWARECSSLQLVVGEAQSLNVHQPNHVRKESLRRPTTQICNPRYGDTACPMNDRHCGIASVGGAGAHSRPRID